MASKGAKSKYTALKNSVFFSTKFFSTTAFSKKYLFLFFFKCERYTERKFAMIKFSCEKVLLQSAIAVASRAVAQKSSIPALEGLLIHVDH